MFSHVTVGSNDFAKSAAFYDAVLAPIGLRRRKVEPDGGPKALCWELNRGGLPRFYVYQPFDGAPASNGNGAMIAFLASCEDAVVKAYNAGLGAGGASEGAPALRAHYGQGYFGAYLRDPDGNKVHVVYRGDLPGVNHEHDFTGDSAEPDKCIRQTEMP